MAVLFAAMGVVGGVWAARIPAVKESLGLSDGALGIALIGAPAGLVLATMAAGRIVDRFGSARPCRLASVILVVSPVGMGLARNQAELMIALLAYGAAGGTTDVAMNVQAVGVERGYGRPLMSSFHGLFSFGLLGGALLGGLSAWACLGPALTFAAVGLALAVAVLAAGRTLLRGAEMPSAPEVLPDDGWAAPAARAEEGAAARGGPGNRRPAGTGASGRRPATGGAMRRRFAGVTARVANPGRAVLLQPARRGSGGELECGLPPGRSGRGRGARRGGPGGVLHHDGLRATVRRPAGGQVRRRAADARQRLPRRGRAGCGAAQPQPGRGGGGLRPVWRGLVVYVPAAGLRGWQRQPGAAGQHDRARGRSGYAGGLTGPVVIGGVASLSGLPLALGIPVILAGIIGASARALRPIGRPGAA